MTDSLKPDLRRAEPYHNLSHGSSASASDSILLDSTASPISSILHYSILLLRNGTRTSLPSPSLPLIDLATLLCSPLTIALANVPYSSSTIYTSFLSCVYLSIAILSLMLLVVGIALVKIYKTTTKKTTTKMDRHGAGEFAIPETLAGKMSLLAGSGELLTRFRDGDLGRCGQRERDRIVKGWGETYAMRDVDVVVDVSVPVAVPREDAGVVKRRRRTVGFERLDGK